MLSRQKKRYSLIKRELASITIDEWTMPIAHSSASWFESMKNYGIDLKWNFRVFLFIVRHINMSRARSKCLEIRMEDKQ